MLRFVEGRFNISEIRFGLADLLITRDEQNDWKEAKEHYDYVLEHAPYGYLRAAAMIGKAELAIRFSDKKDINHSIELAQRAYKQLLTLVGSSDFYTVKCSVVEAELRLKRNEKKDKAAALKLFEKVIENTIADPYFRARAIVGHAELLLYEKRTDLNKEIQLCHDAIELLEDKPNDYFSIKARILQGEYILRRMTHYDKSRATGIFMGIIGNKNADKDLVARAKLNLAEISDNKKAINLVKEVLATKPLDNYLFNKAESLLKSLKSEK